MGQRLSRKETTESKRNNSANDTEEQTLDRNPLLLASASDSSESVWLNSLLEETCAISLQQHVRTEKALQEEEQLLQRLHGLPPLRHHFGRRVLLMTWQTSQFRTFFPDTWVHSSASQVVRNSNWLEMRVILCHPVLFFPLR